MSPNIRWLLPRPAKKALRGLVLFAEETAKQSAEKLGLNTAEIRALPHKTTRRNKQLLSIQNHLTLYWYDEIMTKDSKGKDVTTKTNEKQGECFVDDNNTRMLRDEEIDQNTKTINKSAEDPSKNPHTWPK